MNYLSLTLLIGYSTASLTPWNTTDCVTNEKSCSADQSAPGPGEEICNATGCFLKVGIILPSDSVYILNLDKALEELEKARDEAHRRQILPKDIIHVTFNSYNDRCLQAYATIATINAYSEFGAHVIFGPICDYCLASAARTVKFLGSYGTPLITAGGFVFDFVIKKTECQDEFYMLVNSGSVDYQSLSEFFYFILRKYGWMKLALIYEKYDQNEVGGDQSCQLLMKSVIEVMKNNIEGYQFYDGDVKMLNVNYRELLTRDIGVNYGIILVCASHNNTRNLLLEAEDIKMTEQGEYIFLNFDLYNNAPHPSTPWYDPKDDDEKNERARRAYRSLFTFTPWTEAENAENNQTLDGEKGKIYLDGLFDGFLLYSYALNKTLQTDEDGFIVKNSTIRGVDVVSNMYGYQFEGKRENVTINCNGQRIAKYAMMQMGSDDKFHIIASYSTEDKQLNIIKNFTWVSGKNPGDTPVCGYDNSKCPTGSEISAVLIASCVVAIIALLIFLAIFYRHYKSEADINSMSWRINYDDIRYYNKRSSISTSTVDLDKGSLVTLLSDFDGFSKAGERHIYANVGFYKSIRVAIKHINFNTKNELTREQLRELKTMKDLTSDHLVKFYGACVDNPYCIVTHYCPRGSLQDVLEHPITKIDWHFNLSLMLDITIGMEYLHNSDIKYHGNLSSHNCLVDSRFVVKITDFGVQFLRQKNISKDSHEYWQNQLWTAPELLRLTNGNVFTPQNYQTADTYSFGIIVHEIVTREGVFYLGPDDNKSKQEIVEAVRDFKDLNNSNKALRPLITDDCVNEIGSLMKQCWDEEATIRPDFFSLKNMIRKINKANGNDNNLLVNLLSRMEQYANNLEVLVEERTADYLDEKRKCEDLLYQLLPQSVATQLIKRQPVEAETFEQVTIYFSDIVGFTVLSAQSTPLQVVNLLNDLYTTFDSIIEKYEVYKVETIGDAYMVVSGLPLRNGDKHASEIAKMSLELLDKVKLFKIRHLQNEPLMLRIGLHSGPCVAGVVGLKMPRYCLFGDTVNTASRMESNGEALKIHVSSATKECLDKVGTFDMKCRGELQIKGKGTMTTYWLNGEIKQPIEKPEIISSEIIRQNKHKAITLSEKSDDVLLNLSTSLLSVRIVEPNEISN